MPSGGYSFHMDFLYSLCVFRLGLLLGCLIGRLVFPNTLAHIAYILRISIASLIFRCVGRLVYRLMHIWNGLMVIWKLQKSCWSLDFPMKQRILQF